MLELYGTGTCPYTAELREDLRWRKTDFIEYDVEIDGTARERLLQLLQTSGGERTVPVVVEDGRVLQIGMNGRGCYINSAP